MGCTKANKPSKFLMQILLAPIKLLNKARELCIKGMEDSAGKVGYTTLVFGGPASQNVFVAGSSFSFSSSQSPGSNEKVRQLSRRRSSITSSSNIHNIRTDIRHTTMVSVDVRRSYSVGLGKIGRIDEERPCSFREEDDMDSEFYPRSRSHGVNY